MSEGIQAAIEYLKENNLKKVVYKVSHVGFLFINFYERIEIEVEANSTNESI
jgi:hypothetical protein